MPLFKSDAYRMMTRLIDPDAPAVFIDVGANIGQGCRRICDEFFRARVFAFEPAPATAAQLRDHTGDLSGVTVIESAVGDTTGTLDLHVAANNLMSSALPPSDLGSVYHGAEIKPIRTVRVPTTTLDDFVARRALARVDMVKIDVQGLECAVLAGARALLTRGDVLAVNCEAQLLAEYTGASTFTQIDAMLRGYGYALHQIHECWSNGPEQQTTCIDGLWLREDALARLRRACSLDTPATRLATAARHAAAAGKKSLALYGAGRHTRALAPHFDACPLPVKAVIDDSASGNAAAPHLLAGRPVIRPPDAPAHGIDAVVLSSDCYEEDLWQASAALRSRGTLVMPLYRTHGRSAHTPTAAASTPADPAKAFRYRDYLRLNQRRLEHLASLNLNLQGRRVLEVGAGVGDLTGFWVERGCTVRSTDARPDHLRLIAHTYGPEQRVSVGLLDLDIPPVFTGEPFDIVFAYGLLYHLSDPIAGLAYMAAACGDAATGNGLLLLETCVSFGDDEALHPVSEDRAVPSQALSGQGCRPTRAWVRTRLREAFPHVYVPRAQPDHAEFPLDWAPTAAPRPGQLTRAVFVASRAPLNNPLLIESLPARQTACNAAPAHAPRPQPAAA